jgi:hypothetical protein
MLGRQIGMVIGPAFNFLLLNMNYKMGPFYLDKLSGPGLLMTIAWTLLQIFVLFFYKNLHEFTQEQHTINERTPLLVNSDEITQVNEVEQTEESDNRQTTTASHDQIIEERSALAESQNNSTQENSVKITNSINKSKTYNSINLVDNSETGPFIMRIYNEYIRDEVIVIYFSTFVVFFMQTALEVFDLIESYIYDFICLFSIISLLFSMARPY